MMKYFLWICLSLLTAVACKSSRQVFTIADEMPLFDGKPPEESLREYVFHNLQNPAPHDDCWGRVFVGFIVEKDGSVSNATILRSLHPAFDAEALRVIRSSSGRWTPGKHRGKSVRVKYVFPVLFKW